MFILYFDDGHPHNGAEVEVDSKESKTGRIVAWAPFRKDGDAALIGTEIPLSDRRVGLISNGHSEFLYQMLEKFDIRTKYLEFENPWAKINSESEEESAKRNTPFHKFWFVEKCFGYYKVVEHLIAQKSMIVDDEFMERVASECEQSYMVTNAYKDYPRIVPGTIEQNQKFNELHGSVYWELNSIQAMKFCGFPDMELALEKTVSGTKFPKIDMEYFNSVKPGQVFLRGIAIDAPGGVNMTNSGKFLRFVVKKGDVNDWCVYVHWANAPWIFIVKSGDKVNDMDNVKNVVHCDDEVLKLYRK